MYVSRRTLCSFNSESAKNKICRQDITGLGNRGSAREAEIPFLACAINYKHEHAISVSVRLLAELCAVEAQMGFSRIISELENGSLPLKAA